ncbi:MAG: TlpA family protein disulfide reductase [Betaproteobacteria bacterium]|nr:TlpA family protein disulfide reductase [Betaproteobacteria bacterium]
MLRGLLFAFALCFAAAGQAQVFEGRPVAAFDTQLLDGKALPGTALQGKAVLVVFWATWCPSCQRELPELQKLYEKHRAKGFEILALSVDADRFTVEEFWKDHDYSFPVAMNSSAQAKVFGQVRGTPTLYLIDRKGVLRMARVGGMGLKELEARLKPLL